MGQKKRKRRYKGQVFQVPGRPGWYIRLRVLEKRVTRKGGDTADEAEIALAEALQRVKRGLPIEDPKPKDVDLGEFIKDHLRFCKAKHAATTYKDETYRLNRVAAHFKGRQIADIAHKDVDRFMLGLAENGAKIPTRNRYLALIRRMFERAIDCDAIQKNPCERMHQVKEEERAVPVLSLDEQAALVDACHTRIRDFIRVALDTGLREGELLSLEWVDVDEERGLLTVKRSKSKKPRTMNLTHRVRELLSSMRKRRTIPLDGPDRVFSGLPAKWSSYDGRLFRKAAESIGHPGLRVHDLRHQTAINLVRAGVQLPDVQKWLGHSSLRMTMRYSAHAPENSGELALAKLEKRIGETPSVRTGTR